MTDICWGGPHEFEDGYCWKCGVPEAPPLFSERTAGGIVATFVGVAVMTTLLVMFGLLPIVAFIFLVWLIGKVLGLWRWGKAKV